MTPSAQRNCLGADHNASLKAPLIGQKDAATMIGRRWQLPQLQIFSFGFGAAMSGQNHEMKVSPMATLSVTKAPGALATDKSSSAAYCYS